MPDPPPDQGECVLLCVRVPDQGLIFGIDTNGLHTRDISVLIHRIQCGKRDHCFKALKRFPPEFIMCTIVQRAPVQGVRARQFK